MPKSFGGTRGQPDGAALQPRWERTLTAVSGRWDCQHNTQWVQGCTEPASPPAAQPAPSRHQVIPGKQIYSTIQESPPRKKIGPGWVKLVPAARISWTNSNLRYSPEVVLVLIQIHLQFHVVVWSVPSFSCTVIVVSPILVLYSTSRSNSRRRLLPSYFQIYRKKFWSSTILFDLLFLFLSLCLKTKLTTGLSGWWTPD